MHDLPPSDELKQLYEDHYAGGASEWRRLGALDKAEHIVTLCRDVPHASILELGAGDGSILQRLAEVGFGEQLYALELSTTAVATIQARGISRVVECRAFDGDNVPYRDGSFDLVILSHVIEHLEFPRKILYEAARVAGFVFIEVPVEDTARLRKNFVMDKVGHINFYSPKTIRLLAQSCRLKVLKQIVASPSRAICTYHRGRVGVLNYYFKRALLQTVPGIAPAFFTFNSALLCQADRSR